MPRQIKRRPIADIDPLFHHYIGQRMLRERSSTEEERDKKEMMEILASSGEEDTAKHRRLPITPHEYTNPKGEGKTVTGVKRQRNVTQVLDQEATMALLKKKKLLKRCTKTVTVLSEEDVLACNWESLITDEELKALYSENETFSFILEYD